MARIKLRKAQKSDLPFIKAYVEKFKLDDENMRFAQFIVAEEGEKLVGFGRIKPYQTCFELGGLGVLAPYRRQGIGATIVQKLIQDFPSPDIWITTDLPEYFRRFGFKPTEEAPQEIKDKIKGVCQTKQRHNAIIMLLQKEVKQ